MLIYYHYYTIQDTIIANLPRSKRQYVYLSVYFLPTTKLPYAYRLYSMVNLIYVYFSHHLLACLTCARFRKISKLIINTSNRSIIMKYMSLFIHELFYLNIFSLLALFKNGAIVLINCSCGIESKLAFISRRNI
jgi:hypothetical protein